MTKTASARTKAMPISTSKAGYFLLYSGIIMAFVAVSLLLAWIIYPSVFMNYVFPIVALFLPITFYAVVAIGIYYKKYRIRK